MNWNNRHGVIKAEVKRVEEKTRVGIALRCSENSRKLSPWNSLGGDS